MLAIHCWRFILMLALLASLALSVTAQSQPIPIYVDADATGGTQTGNSWADAYLSLQDALSDSRATSQPIWVADGTYYPDEFFGGATDTDNRNARFELADGMAIFGGFVGTETNLDQRDVANNPPVILSGDIDQNDVDPIGGDDNSNNGNAYQVVYIAADFPPIAATLDGLTITAGYGSTSSPAGGGIYNLGAELTIRNSRIVGNVASSGAGIYLQANDDLFNGFFGGTLTLSNSEISGNLGEAANQFSTARGAGIYGQLATVTITNSSITGNTSAEGGGIYLRNTSTFSISNSTLADNTADSGAGFYSTDFGNINLANVAITGNTAGGFGGGFYLSESTLNMTNGQLSGNTANFGGGLYTSLSSTLTFDNVPFTDNSATSDGGGILNGGSDLTLRNSTLTSNTAGEGAGIYSSGSSSTTRLVNSTLNSNTATSSGGGIYTFGGNLHTVNTTLTQNSAPDGGAMYLDSDTRALITNTTLSGNTATNQGGGILFDIPNVFNATMTIRNSTITGNMADSGGGVFHNDTGFMVAGNTLIAGNSATSNSPECGSHDGDGLLISEGGNVFGTNGDVGGCVPDEFDGTVPDVIPAGDINTILGALADNGGAVETHALVRNSPAIDAGDNSNIPDDVADLNDNDDTSEPVPFDARGSGFPRTFDGDGDSTATVDSGAVEVQSVSVDNIDLLAEFFAVTPDYVRDGSTQATYRLRNALGNPSGTFEVAFYYSQDAVCEPTDDLLTTVTLEDLPGNSSTADLSESLTLDQALLTTHARLADPANQTTPYTSLEAGSICLIVDSGDAVTERDEANNANQGPAIDSDDITYFPWDVDRNGEVTTADAILLIRQLGQINTTLDMDGNGVITPAEVIDTVLRIGYTRNDAVIETESAD